MTSPLEAAARRGTTAADVGRRFTGSLVSIVARDTSGIWDQASRSGLHPGRTRKQLRSAPAPAAPPPNSSMATAQPGLRSCWQSVTVVAPSCFGLTW